ncbi:MAG: hypothetical protein Q9227_001080 [Pyrenula ochraceoflavens]
MAAVSTLPSTTTITKRRNRPPSLLACINCRRKHLKCTAEVPVCSRCQSTGAECVYLQSRRGYKGFRRTSNQNQEKAPPPPPPVSLPLPNDDYNFNFPQDNASLASLDDFLQRAGDIDLMLGSSPQRVSNVWDFSAATAQNDPYASSTSRPSPSSSLLSSNQHGTTGSESSYPDHRHGSDEGPMPQVLGSSHMSVKALSDQLIDVYYSTSHPSFPFVLPRTMLQSGMVNVPSHLKTAMQFRACHHFPGYPQEALRDATNAMLSDPQTPNDGFKVQSLLLFGMTLYLRTEMEQAIPMINSAVELGLKLQMHRSTFNSQPTAQNHNSPANPHLAESWNRTFWCLFIIDVTMASLAGGRHNARLIPLLPTFDIPLPSEEAVYDHLLPLPPPRTLNSFIDRAFSDENYPYSSFAYKIEAMRLTGIVHSLGADPFTPQPDAVAAADASLHSYLLSLPPSKRDLIPMNSSPVSATSNSSNTNQSNAPNVDEILFASHTSLHVALISLHRPRSNLTFIQNHYPNRCHPSATPTALPLQSYDTHRAKALQAANAITTATSLHVPLLRHSPCFICEIAQAAIVYLPAYIMETDRRTADSIKQRLQLLVNALNTIGEVWALAKDVKRQIAFFAKEMFAQVAAAEAQVQAHQQHQPPPPHQQQQQHSRTHSQSTSPSMPQQHRTPQPPPPPPTAADESGQAQAAAAAAAATGYAAMGRFTQQDFEELFENDRWLEEITPFYATEAAAAGGAAPLYSGGAGAVGMVGMRN